MRSLNQTIFNIAIYTALAVATVVLLSYLYLNLNKEVVQMPPQQEVFVTQSPYKDDVLYDQFLSKVDLNEPLGGDILVTSVERVPGKDEPVTDEGRIIPMRTYVYHVDEGVIELANIDYPVWFIDQNSQGDHLLVAQPSFTDPEYDLSIYNPAVYLMRDSVATKLNYESPSSITGIHRRLPRWSHSETQYLYTAYVWESGANRPPIEDITSWKIFINDISGSSTPNYLADGYGAVWSANDEFVIYAKQDGVYARRVAGGIDYFSPEILLVKSRTGPMTLANQINVSDDGSFLAVPNPVSTYRGESYIDIYQLDFSSAESPATLVRRIPTDTWLSIWPVFSPGNRYLSLQASKLDTETNTATNKIRIYDMVNESYIKELDINNFYYNYAFNTDWVEELSI